ncbi:uncharacterized protein LOC143012482 isoform X2 [Genypterus blacodes]|uniref:uncharacterized protein LOC143012482 isoform X2 n=1 Tax=Genypterus blacodes TaxID=154954 RepID=UPI003F758633
MSVKRKKPGLVISWQKSFSFLAPWRKGKGEALPESDVVLTKMKLFNNFHEKLLMADDSASTISMGSVSEQDITDPSKASEANDLKSGHPQMELSTDYLAIFTDSQLPRLYKFESEDSGVELPSGANSPSTPTGSEQSFVVHSRGSSCDSCHLNPDPTSLPDKLLTHEQSSDIKQEEDPVDNIQENVCTPSEELSFLAEEVELHEGEDIDQDQCRASGNVPGGDEISEQLEENNEATKRLNSEDSRPGDQSPAEACDDSTGNDFEMKPLRKSSLSDSLEEYMDECCRLSEAQQTSSNPLGSGLGYLEHICQLIEKIGQLQETNLRLQRQLCCLQKDSRMTKTKEDFFRQHCSCGVASVTFQDAQKRHSRDVSSDASAPSPVWVRRGLNRRSYPEGEIHFLGDSTEGISSSPRRRSESYTWGRVKDLVRKTKLRNQSRLGLSSTSLKMSCPQLYRPDLGPVQLPVRNRNSMISLRQPSKLDIGRLDIPWLQ